MGRLHSLPGDDKMRAALESDVRTTLKTVGWDLSDLDSALSEVEAHRSSFAIDDAEFARRRRLLAELRAKQQDIAVELSRTDAAPSRVPRESVSRVSAPSHPKPRVSEREVWHQLFCDEPPLLFFAVQMLFSAPKQERFAALDKAIQDDNDDFIYDQEQQQQVC